MHIGRRWALGKHIVYIEQNHVTMLDGALQRDIFLADARDRILLTNTGLTLLKSVLLA